MMPTALMAKPAMYFPAPASPMKNVNPTPIAPWEPPVIETAVNARVSGLDVQKILTAPVSWANVRSVLMAAVEPRTVSTTATARATRDASAVAAMYGRVPQITTAQQIPSVLVANVPSPSAKHIPIVQINSAAKRTDVSFLNAKTTVAAKRAKSA